MYDFCVIGGGVVGTAIFNKLIRLGVKTVLLEKENDVGFGASKANTALIHSGIDCKPGTLKAKLNVRGNELYDVIAKRLNVPFVRCGHLIVGNDPSKLNNLLERAKANGVPGVKVLNQEKLKKLEPNISSDINMALFVPTGGMIESYNLAVAFAEEGIVNGGDVLLEFNTKKIVRKNGCFNIVSTSGKTVEARILINAAASGFNDINKLIKGELFDIELRRGEYFLLDKSEKGYVSHPIFPLPTEKSKGILVSPSVHGNILVGPTSVVCDGSTKTTTEGLAKIKTEVKKNFTNIPFNKNIRVFSGVRCLVGDDFVIEKSKKVDGLVNIAGICSPGLSAAPAIAEHVAKLCGLNPDAEVKGLKKRPKKIVLDRLSVEEQNLLIKKRPDYGKVVCKCENISLGEIKDAVCGVLPARSVDAVKRRTRAGMGRCQSGFCIFEVMEIIAKANNIKLENVQKDGVNSQILKSDIKS